jgi:uncharacterized protein (TIGR02449 family)
MSDLHLVQQIAERVDRLLLRQEEMLKEQELLRSQVKSLTTERDALRQRLQLARQRVDQILTRLPSEAALDTQIQPDEAPESEGGIAS